MKKNMKIDFLRYLLFFCLLLNQTLQAQNDVSSGEVFFNYGSATGSISQYYSSSFTIGQPMVGPYFGAEHQGAIGFWSRFLLAPKAPETLASEGEYPDRILIKWSIDPLSPAPDLGFNLYRDGSFLAKLDFDTYEFIDFNVIPGNFYTYEIRGINNYGEGFGKAVVGFLNPNGKITGQVTTINNNPVAGVQVTLEPTIGNALSFDGMDDEAIIPHHPDFTQNQMTVSCWVKIGATYTRDGIVDLGADSNSNWFILSTDADKGEGKGVVIGIGEGTANQEMNIPFSTAPDEWHHLAFTYNGQDVNAYLDGELRQTMSANMITSVQQLFLGKTAAANSHFKGKLDDLRIYKRQLAQSEIISSMKASVPSTAEGLVAYWKFDEGMGYKIFDLTENKLNGLMSGEVVYSDDRADVLNAGMTDESGHYLIDGINYGGGASFTASPAKSFHYNNALEFNATDQQYATLTNFTPKDTGTIEIFFRPSTLTGEQVILAQSNRFELKLVNTDLQVSWNGDAPTSIGSVNTNTEYTHVAIAYEFNGSSPNITAYLNGENPVITTASAITDWGTDAWQLGRSAASTNYFTGLIDEVIFFDNNRSQPQIQADRVALDVTDLNLMTYFSLNESVDIILSDQSPNNQGSGTIYGASWTSVTANPEEVPHEFNPNSRIVSLDPTNTSVDNVDFEDISTVGVSGYVRFANTSCFAEGVEILVNGQSNTPPIYTNNEGRFVVDFEPGSSVRLTPKFKEHQFIPAFWDINNIVVPKSGIVFNDQTVRRVEGKLIGGDLDCNASLVGTEDSVVMELASLDGCYIRYFQIENGLKKYQFRNIPPIEYKLSLVQHNVSVIKDFFDAIPIDLVDEDTLVNFIYEGNIAIETTELDTNACGDPMLVQFERYRMDIKVYEEYYGRRCYLDSVTLSIDNDISGDGANVMDTSYHASSYKHLFYAGSPNILGNHLKYINIKAEDARIKNRIATDTVSAVVTGIRKRPTEFLTTSPEIPWLILRDPPGDASYSTWEKGKEQCIHLTQSIQTDETESSMTTLHLGKEFESGALFWSVPTVIEADASAGYTATKTQTSATEEQMCISATNTFQTNEDELIVGSEMGGDIYVGGAMNMIFGIADELLYDTSGNQCRYRLDTTIVVDQNGLATQYMYSEYHIVNKLIPRLELVDSLEAADMWRQVVAKNAETKAAAHYSENLSFDGGVIYEYEKKVESEKSITIDWETTFSNDFAVAAGFKIGGSGLSNETNYSMATTVGGSQGSSTKTENTVSYHLEDNDLKDNFTVDILEDEVFGVPVFKIKSGQSSCPHEPGTQHMDEVSVSIAETVVANVPETEAAVFHLTVGNISPGGFHRLYRLSLDNLTNPDGAAIFVNGEAIEDVLFPLDAGETAEVTVSVEKGPTAYEYEDLEIIFYAECERERAHELGIHTDSLFEQHIKISAYFIKSCSDVNISSPNNGWVVTPDDNNSLPINLDEYNKNDSDLELIKVQYRPVNGNGIWVNIMEIEKEFLGEVYESINWDVSSLPDGDYELRAVTECQGNLPKGMSDVVVGKLEREPPVLLGVPSPSDGFLDPSDAIYIEFSEDVDCSRLTSLPGATEDFVGLFDTETNQPLDIEISCLENRIYLVPTIQNKFIENKTLRAEVRGINDLARNPIEDPISWEFYVDRNPLKWVGGDIEAIKYEDESWRVTRTIQNNGGQSEDFTLENLPQWLQASITSGTIAAGGSQTVVFSVADQIANDQYDQTIQLKNKEGEEPLRIQLAALCRPPEWTIQPASFDYNMTFTVELNIEGTVSEDEFDLVGAFVGEDLRGMAKVEYVPALDKYLAFLTVYSNQISGEELSFRIWDASDCLLYGTVVEQYTFVNDGLHGTPENPDVLHTQNIVLSKIPIHEGWNWISFNLDMPDKDINKVLESMHAPDNVLIKNQVAFSQYYNTFGVWAGSLNQLGYRTMYQVKGTQHDTITLLGRPINPDTVNIPIKIGWNWIPYLPQRGASVDTALKELTPLNGDIVKGQSTFAQYVAGIGWIGSLEYMSAPNGYLLKSGTTGVLKVNPSKDSQVPNKAFEEQKALSRSGRWEVNPSDFEYSMNLICLVANDGKNMLSEGDEVGAFVGEEVRGVANSMYIESLDAYLIFLTVYSNTNAEDLSFRYYQSEQDQEYALQESIPFAIDAIVGDVFEPQALTMDAVTTSTADLKEEYDLKVMPNPLEDYTMIYFDLAEKDEITFSLLDANGSIILRDEQSFLAGHQQYRLNAKNDTGQKLPPGAYYLKMQGLRGEVMIQLIVIQ